MNDQNPSYLNKTFLILSFGYLIDYFDLTLFAVIRHSALLDIGVEEKNILSTSLLMFNLQALGCVIGGLIFGIWGDKFGRISAVRFGILLYSIANIANIFVTTVPAFGVMRFLAGVGLAAELAASITLLSEIFSKEKRGIASGILFSFGILGGVLATFIGSQLHWKTVLLIGGSCGLILLCLRFAFVDSTIYLTLKQNTHIPRGSLKLILLRKDSFMKLVCLTLGIFPFWFVAFCVNFSPEISKKSFFPFTPNQSVSLAIFFIGSLFGAIFFPFMSKILKSRKKSVLIALSLMLCSLTCLSLPNFIHLELFYLILFVCGFSNGYLGIYILFCAEVFGTNQRNTATSIISNISRGSLIFSNIFVPFIATFFYKMGSGVALCAIFFFFLGIIPIIFIKDTYNKDMDFIEK
ncbi:MFS transporter [Fluviispira multicolorata]|uniref:MFS transporter n=1 Tax=Fluviispira multicolorata TaxID=2654512 RepID=A0A833JDN5_9BACT|nr:MFS transporter [Fluviispira multicolorata]KAB8028581.1 MFS transporter [Fluviispira multicolorata]